MTKTETTYQEALDLLSSCFHYDNKTCEVYEEDLLNYSGFGYECGASKVVIILDDCVLKTSYSGEVSECEDEEGNREITENFPDYANLEYQLYQAAAEVGLDKFFAKTSKVDDYVYEQSRVDASIVDLKHDNVELPWGYFHGRNKPRYYNEKDTDKIIEYCEKNGLHKLYFRIKFNAIRYFLAEYSIEELKKLNEFLIEYDINDISETNCGWIDGNLVIFDFCGFGSETEKILS